jgi:hypothetical protein
MAFLLHNRNQHPSIPLAGAVYMKKTLRKHSRFVGKKVL